MRGGGEASFACAAAAKWRPRRVVVVARDPWVQPLPALFFLLPSFFLVHWGHVGGVSCVPTPAAAVAGRSQTQRENQVTRKRRQNCSPRLPESPRRSRRPPRVRKRCRKVAPQLSKAAPGAEVVGPISTNTGRFGPSVGQFWPNLDAVWQTSTNIARCGPKIWRSLTRSWQGSTKICRCGPNVGRSELVKFGAGCAGSRQKP